MQGQIPNEVALTSTARTIYAMTIGAGLLTPRSRKRRARGKKGWLEAAERILLIEPSGKENQIRQIWIL
jgi:hypothetical protein